MMQQSLLTFFQAMKNCCYDEDSVLLDCGISIDKQLTRVEGRVLESPKVLLSG